MDYQSLLNKPVMFYVGERNGSERCTNVTLNEDLLVECEEEFSVSLMIATDKPNLSLGNDVISVTIVDSNC